MAKAKVSFVAFILPLVWPLVLAAPLLSQRVDSTNTHYRVWAVDRVVTDAQGRRMPAHAQGKLAFVALYAPGGNLCAVEYVGASYQDFDSLRQDTGRDAAIRVFDKAFTKRSVFEGFARAAGFTQLDLNKFFLRVR